MIDHFNSIDKILRSYSVGCLIKFHRLGSWANENYKITTTKGDYLLKINRQYKLEEHLKKIKEYQNIASSGIVVPAHIESIDGNVFLDSSIGLISIFRWIKGSIPKEIDFSLAKDTISLLSRIHAVGSDPKTNTKSWFNQHWIRERLNQLSKAIDISKFSKELDGLPVDEIFSLPKSLVHGDVHSKNMIIDKKGRLILIDWEEICYAPSLLDVTMFLNYLKSNCDTDYLIEAYSEFRFLSQNERLLIPSTMKLSKLIHQVWFSFEYHINRKKTYHLI